MTVERLRRRLASAAGAAARDLVQTVPEGYRLDATGIVVDAVEFEQRVTDAGQALLTGKARTASSRPDCSGVAEAPWPEADDHGSRPRY